MEVIRRAIWGCTIIALLVFLSIFLHKTKNYLDTSPMATDDDAISNVAINLWQNQRYSFMANPSIVYYVLDSSIKSLPPGKHFNSTSHYYNYGWFYFVVAGFINWTFGDNSMFFFRMMNPWGLLLISVIGLFFFRKFSLLPGALLTIGLLWRFLLSVGPVMARPDIAVSVAAVLFFVSIFFAIERCNFWWWFGSGFFAITAATSHFVAWSIAFVSIVVLFFYTLIERENKSKIKKSISGLLTGGVFGLLVFLVMIGFRVEDIFIFISTLKNYLKTIQPPGFHSNLIQSLKAAWTASGFIFYLAVIGCCKAILLLVFSLNKKKKVKLQIFSFLLAPLLTTIFYVLSLGMYKSIIQPSYGILIYVSALWTMAAAVATLIFLLDEDENKLFFSKIIPYYNVLATLLLVISIFIMVNTQPNLEKQKFGWVKFSDYERQVIDALPPKAYAWGMVNLGFTSGVRTDLVNSNVAIGAAIFYTDLGWEKIAPEYLVLNSQTLDNFFFNGPLQGKDNQLAFFRKKLPLSIHYELIRIVYAQPYGSTFIYQKIDSNQGEVPRALTIAVNDGISPEWYMSTRRITTPVFERTKAVTIDASSSGGGTANSYESLGVELQKGFYLVHVRVKNSGIEQMGSVVATSGVYQQMVGDSRLQQVTLFRGKNEAKFIVDHLGGKLYFSYFPGRGRNLLIGKYLEILEIQQVVESDLSEKVEFIRLPIYSKWKVDNDFEQKILQSGSMIIKSNNQIVSPLANIISPMIEVQQNQEYSLVLPTEIQEGVLNVGIYTDSGKSLLFGEKKSLPARINFFTHDTQFIQIKIFMEKWNINQQIQFKLLPGILRSNFIKKNKIDELLFCFFKEKWLINEKVNLCQSVTPERLKRLMDDLQPIKNAEDK